MVLSLLPPGPDLNVCGSSRISLQKSRLDRSLTAIQVRPNCVISGFWAIIGTKGKSKREAKNTRQKLMKMDQIGLCQTWHVPRYEGSLRSVLSHSALQLNELKKGKAQLGCLENNSQIVTVNAGLKWCGLHAIFSHKTGSEGKTKKCIVRLHWLQGQGPLFFSSYQKANLFNTEVKAVFAGTCFHRVGLLPEYLPNAVFLGRLNYVLNGSPLGQHVSQSRVRPSSHHEHRYECLDS